MGLFRAAWEDLKPLMLAFYQKLIIGNGVQLSFGAFLVVVARYWMAPVWAAFVVFAIGVAKEILVDGKMRHCTFNDAYYRLWSFALGVMIGSAVAYLG